MRSINTDEIELKFKAGDQIHFDDGGIGLITGYWEIEDDGEILWEIERNPPLNDSGENFLYMREEDISPVVEKLS